MTFTRPAIAVAAIAVAAGVSFLSSTPPAEAQQRIASAAPASPLAAPALRLSLESAGMNTAAGAQALGAGAMRRPAAGAAPALATAPGATATSADDGGVRGVVRAVREATLSSRLAARIDDMPLAEGASFKQGELLVKFDCERQAAEARAANAAVDVQKKTVETNEELDKFESIGKNDLSISKSQLDKARAESDALASQVKDCKVLAPFAGRVIERIARAHEAVAVSQPLLRVVDTSTLELDLIVPSAWLQWLGEGAEFQFRIDETGQTVTGAVARLTPTVDPVSKTIKVIGRFRPGKNTHLVLPGMSGTAQFERRG